MLLHQDRGYSAITLMLDIAFHAGRGNEVVGSADVAERLGAAKRGIEPIFQALSRARLLESVRGPKGGYRLAKRARDITLLEVLLAVIEEPEGTQAVNGALEAAVVVPLWRELEAVMRATLADVTLEDLVKRAIANGLSRPHSEPLNFVI